ncbi:SpoVR family protein [Phosphitispora fastidiosa]|uniref:SpoVR family protein n=1 Tax=Phosphitispora fastidiosa TaxID=2837202 RepID=UPI001E3DDD41|nr:SpoVR family protein [Phosphitispora fastidiosa]MBU7005430.1 stage V sporulation protein R [Phosphitispora fastidiosa]
MTSEEIKLFQESLEQISNKAKEFGLDFYDMRFEIIPSDIIYTFGAYGMPTRYSHWSFGKAFHRMKTQYDYNLSKIYELVINSNPCYAFLLDGNLLIQNKLVAAHVYAHCDFFKNNKWFRHTSRDMVESMSRNADRIREYEYRFGRQRVESLLDSALAIQEHIDPRHNIGREQAPQKEQCQYGRCRQEHKKRVTPYDDLWNIGVRQETEKDAVNKKKKKFPVEPEKDLLKFIAVYGRELEEWERDILFIVREEMLYFWPQVETKIMNEGWATLWHSRIMREIDLDEEETIEFAKMHAGVVQKSRSGLNPYYIGLKIWEDIEKRWDKPSEEEKKKYGRLDGQGRKKVFEVRETENDISFIRNYLTKELVEELDLFLFQKVYTKWQVVETEWEKVREGFVTMLTNGGFPHILVEDGNYKGDGELYLRHSHDSRDLDLYYLEKTLPYVYKLWGRTVHMETVVDNKKQLYSYNGTKISKQSL